MGYTLVSAFSDAGYQTIADLLEKADAKSVCKIPYGRDCERTEADGILKHHITLFHWSEKDDETYLGKLKTYRFETVCRVMVSGVSLMQGSENSLVLVLNVKAEEGFEQMRTSLEKTLGAKTSSFLHITLAVSQDHHEIQKLHERITAMNVFPFALEIIGLDLYHIWKPVRLTEQYR